MVAKQLVKNLPYYTPGWSVLSWLLCSSGLVLLSWAAMATDDSDEFDELEQLEALWRIADEPYQPITRRLDTAPFVHEKTLSISPSSLDNGWVANRQCHRNFPTFPALQIAFSEDRVRNIQIEEFDGAERAWVEGASVQLEKTGPDTSLCFTSENHTLNHADSNSLTLEVGPYYLRLFDGYFPLRVSLDINYPESRLSFAGLEPGNLEGTRLESGPGALRFSALFEGTLKLRFKFDRR